MKIIFFLFTNILFMNVVYAETSSCLPRAELGESKGGGNLYDRDDKSNIKYLSKFDFGKLTLTSDISGHPSF